MEFLSRKERSVLYFLLGMMTTISVACIYIIFTRECYSHPFFGVGGCKFCSMMNRFPCSQYQPQLIPQIISQTIPQTISQANPQVLEPINQPPSQVQSSQVQSSQVQSSQVQCPQTATTQQLKSFSHPDYVYYQQPPPPKQVHVIPQQYYESVAKTNMMNQLYQTPQNPQPQRYNDSSSASSYTIPETFDDEGYMFTRR
jgi:hypothetical protein